MIYQLHTDSNFSLISKRLLTYQRKYCMAPAAEQIKFCRSNMALLCHEEKDLLSMH